MDRAPAQAPESVTAPVGGHRFADIPAHAPGAPSRREGHPLPGQLRRRMESAFSTSFSEVRVHEGREPEAMGALAYTHGRDIHFSPGRFRPDTLTGQHLLAHELTHVVQQRGGPSVARGPDAPSVLGSPSLEAEANTVGAAAVMGQKVSVSGQGAGIQKAGAKADPNLDPKNIRLADMSKLKPWKPKSSWRGVFGNLATGTGTVVGGVGGSFLGGMLGGVGAVGGGVVGAGAGGALAHKLFSEDPRARAANEMAQFRQMVAEADSRDKGVGAHFVDPSGSARKAELERLKNRKLVTSNTVAGLQAIPGTSLKTKVLNRSAPIVADPKEVNPPVVKLEDQLANPRYRADVAPNPLDQTTMLPDISRLGLVQRQKAVMEAASDAEPFLRALESGGDLSATHVRKADALDNKNKPKPGFQWQGTGHGGSNQMHRASGGVVRAVGADEFTNLPNPPGAPPDPNRVSSLLPVLSKPKTARPSTDALKSTGGTWSEADLHPLAKKRDAHRLLHTSKDSIVASTGKKIDIPTFVTTDHYTSAVPVTSVKDKYKAKGGYKLKPAYKTRPGLNSLQAHDAEMRRQAEKAEQARKDAEAEKLAKEKAARDRKIREAVLKRNSGKSRHR